MDEEIQRMELKHEELRRREKTVVVVKWRLRFTSFYPRLLQGSEMKTREGEI